ncbi:hypothetical protein BpHYR1_040239 [Brachionus plicatilis]|uniref:Uncharacterized protein n=1 Tax=Brachionus plicatilis TaxID=10195 RepID=A0A3M7R426_BRAPC|nr:hypothetical protein BpHYR1_040239 [Brachionus plicatilis]
MFAIVYQEKVINDNLDFCRPNVETKDLFAKSLKRSRRLVGLNTEACVAAQKTMVTQSDNC